jgi:predicted metalloprotease with PDZ domain
VEADATRSAWKPSTQSARERPNKLSEFAGNVAEEIMIHQAQNWLAPTSGASPWPGTFRGLDYPYIIDVDPAGYAADAGVRPGDILLNYNGIDLASETSTNKVLYRAINQAAANRQQEVLIVVSRNGQVLVGVVPAGVRMGITYLTSR